MKTSDFYFDLPPELIAQTPLERRDGSRLLTLDRATGETKHLHFYDLPALLEWNITHTGSVPCDCFSVSFLFQKDMWIELLMKI